jgi:hypothetical protein
MFFAEFWLLLLAHFRRGTGVAGNDFAVVNDADDIVSTRASSAAGRVEAPPTAVRRRTYAILLIGAPFRCSRICSITLFGHGEKTAKPSSNVSQ